MFLSSLFKKPEHEISVVFDVSSRSVGGALLKLSRTEKPQILYTVRLPIPFNKAPNPTELVTSSVNALLKVASTIEKEGIVHLSFTEFKNHKVKDVSLVFSSPWYISQTKIARMQKEKPFTFTESMLKEMMDSEKTSYEKAAAITSKTKEKGIELLEQKVIQIKLNGYETAKPFGKTAFSAEANIFSSFTDSLLLKQVKDAVLSSFHPKKVEIHSYPGVAYSVLRDIFPGEDNFIIVDAGGEATEISLVKNGVLLETFSFPMGHNHTLRKISEDLNISRDIAVSSLSPFLDGKTFTKTEGEGKLGNIVEAEKNEWSECFQSALKNLSEQGTVPSTAYLIAEMPFSNLFRDAMKLKTEEKDIRIQSITEINHETLSLHYEQNGIGQGDIFLSTEAIFLNKIFSKEK